MPQPATKICVRCGRTIVWRRKWARDWTEVRYCSGGCRRHRPGAEDEALEVAIRELLTARTFGATICPSEAARRVFEDWRSHMEAARQAARRLVAAGVVEITQGGRIVDPNLAKGPIRLRLRRR